VGRIIRDHLAPDFEFEALITGGTYKGADGFRELMDDIRETVNYTPEVERPSIWTNTCCSWCGCRVAVRGAASP
jgi:hypothetical protein